MSYKEPARLKLLALSQAYVRDQRAAGNNLVHLLSMENKFGPYRSLSDARKKELFQEGLHMTVQGYTELGAAIAEGISPIVRQLSTGA